MRQVTIRLLAPVSLIALALALAMCAGPAGERVAVQRPAVRRPAVRPMGQVGISPIHTLTVGKTKCRIFDRYVAFSRPTISSSEDLQVKRIAPGAARDPATLCKKRTSPFALDLTTGNTCAKCYFIGLARDRLLVDEGSGNMRTLLVFDLSTGKQVFKDTYMEQVRYHRGSRVVYDGPAGARSRSMPSCEPPGACVTKRQKLYRAFQKAHAPRFDNTAQPECPKRHIELVPAFFVGWIELDLDTLKVTPSSVLTCVTDPSQL